MAYLNYTTKTTDTTDDLINLGLNEYGLIIDGQKITAGAPDTTSAKYISACLIQNIADGNVYKNVGTTSSPVWVNLGSGGGGGGPITGLTGTPTEVVYIDNSGNGTGDSLFTRNSVTNESYFGQEQSGGVDRAAFELNTNVLGFGLPGVLMSRGDIAGTVGNTIFGILDISSFGGSPYAIIGRATDSVTNAEGNFNLQPDNMSYGVDNGSSSQGTFGMGATGYNLIVGNVNYGGDDRIDMTVDLNGGSGGQYWYIQYKDSTPVTNSIRTAQEGIRFDYNNFSNTPGTYYVFPQADGSAGQVLTTDGSGTLSFTSAGGGASLTQNYIGFGDAFNALGGDASYQYILSDFQVLQTIPSNTGNAGTTTAALAFGPASFGGSGLDDLTLTWNNTTYLSKKYGGNLTIQITANGASDEFFWNYTGPYSETIGTGSGVLIMPGPISLLDTNGNLIAQVEFASTTGHTIGDTWTASSSLSLMPWGHVISDSSIYNYFEIRPAYGRFSIGDATGGMSLAGNGTNITVNDQIATIALSANNQIDLISLNNSVIISNGVNSVLQGSPSTLDIQLGDVSNHGNTTKLTVNDTSRQVLVSAYDAFASLYQLDVSGTSQYARLYAIDGVAYTSAVSATTSNSSLYFQDSVSGTQNIISVAPFSSLMTSVGPTATTNFATQAGFVSAYNGASNESLNIDTELYKLTLGDVDSGANSTTFLIDDPNSQISARTDGSFFVADNLANLFLNVDIANGLYSIGDIDAHGNGNYIRVDDTNSLFNFNNGVIRGNALHNNAVAQGSATEQDVRSGTYTPTGTVGTNVTSVTPSAAQWLRVGNVVTVSGHTLVNVTAAATCDWELSIPVNSTWSGSGNVGGTALRATGGTVDSPCFLQSTTNNRVQFLANTTASGIHVFSYQYTYVVI